MAFPPRRCWLAAQHEEITRRRATVAMREASPVPLFRPYPGSECRSPGTSRDRLARRCGSILFCRVVTLLAGIGGPLAPGRAR